jgi:hypothetical protein
VIGLQGLLLILPTLLSVLHFLEKGLHCLMMLHDDSMVLYQVFMLVLECLMIRVIKVR